MQVANVATTGRLGLTTRLRLVGEILVAYPGILRRVRSNELLSRRGIAGRLVIGAKLDEHVAAHAWVESAGHAVLPVGDHERLTEL